MYFHNDLNMMIIYFRSPDSWWELIPNLIVYYICINSYDGYLFLLLTNLLFRFDIGIRDIEKWTNNLLPSRQFGFVVLTTSGGIMDHEEARRKHLGGKILGFFF